MRKPEVAKKEEKATPKKREEKAASKDQKKTDIKAVKEVVAPKNAEPKKTERKVVEKKPDNKAAKKTKEAPKLSVEVENILNTKREKFVP
jgi:hypothetical protein